MDYRTDHDRRAAAQKVFTVIAWISSNPEQLGDTRAIVKKFDLSWSLKRDLGNGIGRVCFYADDTLREEILDLHLPMQAWFRG